MGGKTKQSQRTKNNARPSSSGRSAELLSSVKLDSGIVNIAGTQLPALFPSLVAPSVDPLINPELQLCLKKLNKKDPITKTKALLELSDVVIGSEVDDVVAALSSWSHFYKILTSDPDRKVREFTQVCHCAIVCVSGRRLAPHLKQLMPAWLQAQYDEHAPAQTCAQNSLAKTFPDSKLPEVLSFCKEPIITQLLDILIGNGETAHIRTTDSVEERELQVSRVLSSSLHGLQYCVRHLPASHSAWLWGELSKLLQHSAFWKRSTSPDVRIRAAWFGAVGSIISRFKGEFGAQYGVKTLRVLVGGRESNPLVAAQLWECLLLFMHNIPNWDQYLEKKELLCKRILDVLESGGWGDARHLSSMLLLILASLPEQILTKDFYVAFFDAIFSGLEKKSILSSKSERQHWISSLEECIRYLSTQAHHYTIEVVTAVHRTWLEKVLTDAEGQTRTHLIKYSAGSMANLLKYWLKQAKEGDDDKYDQLIRNFWQNVGSTLTAQIDKLPLNHEVIDKLIEAHILLLQSLKNSFAQEFKKKHSIKFEVDSKTAERKRAVEPQVTDPIIIERYNHNLHELARQICSRYLEWARDRQVSSPVVSPLITLLVEFDSAQLWTGIARQLGRESVSALYDSELRGWLAGDTMRCKALVDVLFMLMKHLTHHDQDAMLDTFKQFPPSVVEWCISLSLSHPHCLSPSVRRWLRGPVVEATVTSICSRVLDTGDGRAKNLLMMCLNCDANGECVVSEACVSRCVAQVSASLLALQGAPALAALQGAPALAALQGAPALAALQGAPALAALQGAPALAALQGAPALAALQGAPALAALQGAPALAALQGAPALAALQGAPALAALQGAPALAALQGAPALAALQGAPALAALQGAPALAALQGAPALAALQGAPALAALQGAPALAALQGAPAAAALEARCAAATSIAAALPADTRLLTACFSLTATLQRGDPRLSLETWCEVRDAWQDGVTSLDAHSRSQFLLDAAAILHAHLDLNSNLAVKSPQPESSTKSKDSECELNISKMEHIVSQCPSLLWGRAELRLPEVVRFTQTLFHRAPLEPLEPLRILPYAMRHAILTGSLNCPFEDDPVVKVIVNDTLTELAKDDLIAYVNTVLFRMLYLRTMFLSRPDEDANWNWCNELLAETYLEGEFVKCLYDYALICALYEGYAFWPHYKLIEQCKNRLDTLLNDIINETNSETRRSILRSISDLATSKGYFWAYSRKYYEDLIKLKEDQSEVRQIHQVYIPNDKDNSKSEEDNSKSEEDNSKSEEDNSKSEDDNSKSDSDNSQRDNEISESVVESSKIESIRKDMTETREESSFLMKNWKDMISEPTILHDLHYYQAKARQGGQQSEAEGTEWLVALADMCAAHADREPVLSALLADVIRNTTACSPDFIINTSYAHNDVMLYEKDISDAPWSQIMSNASICSFLTARVGCHGWEAESHHWDFTNITVCSLLTSLELSKRNWGTAKVAVVGRSVLRLFGAVRGFVSGVVAQCRRRQPAPHVAALPREWTDIYAPDAHHNLFSLILHVLESSSGTVLNSNHVAVLDALVRSAAHMQWDSLTAADRTGAFSLQRLVAACTATLREPVHVAFKYLAHRVLDMLLKPLVLEDAERLAAWSSSAAESATEESPLLLTLSYYDDALFHLQDIVETALSHLRVCEEVCSLVPFTDAHSLTLGWLLLADILNRQCVLPREDLTYQYIQIYREQKYAEPLLTTALRLLPREVLAQAARAAPHAADSPAHYHLTHTYQDMFTALPDLDVYSWCGGEVIAACACACVSACVRGAGAASVRGYRGAAHHTHAHIMDNITRRYITPHVVKEEFALLQKKSSEIEDTEVTINRSSYEVRCVLTVDEKPIELVVTLARQHPLVLPRLAAPHAAAGNINWILMYLGYQNGTILNALKMWTVSVNNKMERAPQCYICYCRLHHATGRLPGVFCHTCRNKFHNVCLRKWFLTSGKMTCPLCRANF